MSKEITKKEDPLQKLFVSETQKVDRLGLARFLTPYVSINKETESFDFSATFHKLLNSEKILVILAAIKAKHLVLDTLDRIAPVGIINLEVMPIGSVKGSLRTLSRNKEIKSDKNGYYLPNYKLPQIIGRFSKIIKEN